MTQRKHTPDCKPFYGRIEKSAPLRLIRHDDARCHGCGQWWRERDLIPLHGLHYCHHCAEIAERIYANPMPAGIYRFWTWARKCITRGGRS